MNQALFDTVPNKDYLGYASSKSDLKKVVSFLQFHKNDISKATNQPKNSIRYDERMPHELEERLEEIGNIINLTASFFDGDLKKNLVWFKTPNPLLGNISPRDMIRFGQLI